MENKELIQTTWLDIEKIAANEGQIPGVPSNPRKLMEDEYKLLLSSIQENPEMLELSELIVYRYNGVYVVLGGNMRYQAMKELGYKTAPCKIEPPSTPQDILRGHVIKDNFGYGETDEELLAKEWNQEELEDWGVLIAKQEEYSDEIKIVNIKLIFTPEQFTFVKKELNAIDKDNNKALLKILGYGEEEIEQTDNLSTT